MLWLRLRDLKVSERVKWARGERIQPPVTSGTEIEPWRVVWRLKRCSAGASELDRDAGLVDLDDVWALKFWLLTGKNSFKTR